MTEPSSPRPPRRRLLAAAAGLCCAAAAVAGCDTMKQTFTRDADGRITFNPRPLTDGARAVWDKGVAFFKPAPEDRRPPTEQEKAAAASKAEQVARQDASAGQQRSADYYVPVGRDEQKQQVAVQRIDHASNQPVGDVAVLSEADLNEAARNGNTVKIDGHELVGRDSGGTPRS